MPLDHSELNLYSEGSAARSPMAARYLQVPTVLMMFLQEYYGQPEFRWLPGASHFRYFGRDSVNAREQTADALEIHRFDDYRGDRMTDLPKLLLRRTAVAFRQSPVGAGRRMGSANPTANLDSFDYFGSVVTFCLSREVGESEILAAETEQLLTHYRRLIAKRLCLKRAVVTQVGEVGKIREFPDFFATPVVLDYLYEDTVELTSARMPIRSIVLSVD